MIEETDCSQLVLLVQLRNTEENQKGLHDGWLLGTSMIIGVKTVYLYNQPQSSERLR